MNPVLSALHFPPIEELVEWPGLFLKDTPFEVNKVVLLMWAGAIIVFALFWAAGRAASSGNLIDNIGVPRKIGPKVRVTRGY